MSEYTFSRDLPVKDGHGEIRWNRSKKPWVKPLAFYMVECASPFSQGNSPNSTSALSDSVDSRALNRALASHHRKCAGKFKASSAATLAECGQTTRMILGRFAQLLALLKALKKGDLSVLHGALEDLVDGTGRRASKKRRVLSDTALEFNFGWRPLVSDINDGIRVLCDPSQLASLRGDPVKGRGLVRYEVSKSLDRSDPLLEEFATTRVVTALAASRVTVDNPNLHLANSLGLLNPLEVLYELTPWSFLLSWVSNVEDILEAYTYSIGLSVEDTYHTIARRSWGTYQRYQELWPGGDVVPWFKDNGIGRFTRRRLGHPALTPELRFSLPSLTRIVNACSLLTQVLNRR